MSTSQRVSRGFHRLRFLSLTALLVLFPGIASAADKITLNCSGTVADPEKFEVTPAPAESFVIDLDKGAVSTSLLGSFSITKRTEDRIDFKAESGQPGEFTVGSVSRVTGVATVVAWRDDEMLWNYSFKCKRADRLF